MAKRSAKAAAAAAPKKSGEELLADLLGMVPDAAQGAKAEKKSDRPVLDADTELMIEFAGAHVCSKIATERKDVLGDQLKAQVWQSLTDQWYEAGAKPSNPKLQAKQGSKVDTSAIFQLKAMFKVQADSEDNSARGAVTSALVTVGFDTDQANLIYDENVEAEMVTEIRPFNELIQGRWISGDGGREFVPASDVEKSAAKKLLAVATGAATPEPLDAEERAAVIQKKLVYQVKAGFLDRAANYCDDANQLRALLTVIKPQVALSHVKYAQQASGNEKHRRILAAFTEILMGEEAA